LNLVSIRRLRAFLDALKDEGIYVNLNLHVGYEFRPEIDRVPAVAGRFPTQSKPLHIFYPRMVDLQVEYAKKLIEALKLRNAPVLAMLEIDNETSLIDAWQKNSIDRLVTGEYRDELDRQKKAFLDGRPDSTEPNDSILRRPRSCVPEAQACRGPRAHRHLGTGNPHAGGLRRAPQLRFPPGPRLPGQSLLH
jgi:hypothetical protein